MSLKLLYKKQENEYFCGPAIVQMILGSFGKKMSQRRLALLLKTNARTGTSNAALGRIIRKFGGYIDAHSQGSLGEIRLHLRRGNPVIVNYREPEEDVGHFAIVVGITRSSIFLLDPWHGSRFRLSLTYFSSHWFGQFQGRSQQWLMAVSSKPL